MYSKPEYNKNNDILFELKWIIYILTNESWWAVF